MKRKRLFLTVCTISLALWSMAQTKVVNVETPGTLRNLLGDDWLKIESLTVTGTLNGQDIQTLRIMGGCLDLSQSSSHSSVIIGALKHLDMGNTHYVSGEPFRCVVHLSQNTPSYKNAEEAMKIMTVGGNCEDDVIGEQMFFGLKRLQSLILSKYAKKMESQAIGMCCDLQIIGLPNVSTLPTSVLENCQKIERIDMPKSVKSIDQLAFEGCRSLQEVNMPGVEWLSDSTFVYCSRLEKVSFGKIKRIGKAFWETTSLKYIELPEDLSEISDEAFAKCSQLATVISRSKTVPACGTNTFKNVKNCTAYVEIGCGESYRNATGWKDLNIVEGDLTRIRNLSATAQQAIRYNLQGQQLNAPQKGINIIDGKKVLVK